jgi:hypothetical protein
VIDLVVEVMGAILILVAFALAQKTVAIVAL